LVLISAILVVPIRGVFAAIFTLCFALFRAGIFGLNLSVFRTVILTVLNQWGALCFRVGFLTIQSGPVGAVSAVWLGMVMRC